MWYFVVAFVYHRNRYALRRRIIWLLSVRSTSNHNGTINTLNAIGCCYFVLSMPLHQLIYLLVYFFSFLNTIYEINILFYIINVRRHHLCSNESKSKPYFIYIAKKEKKKIFIHKYLRISPAITISLVLCAPAHIRRQMLSQLLV